MSFQSLGASSKLGLALVGLANLPNLDGDEPASTPIPAPVISSTLQSQLSDVEFEFAEQGAAPKEQTRVPLKVSPNDLIADPQFHKTITLNAKPEIFAATAVDDTIVFEYELSTANGYYLFDGLSQKSRVSLDSVLHCIADLNTDDSLDVWEVAATTTNSDPIRDLYNIFAIQDGDHMILNQQLFKVGLLKMLELDSLNVDGHNVRYKMTVLIDGKYHRFSIDVPPTRDSQPSTNSFMQSLNASSDSAGDVVAILIDPVAARVKKAEGKDRDPTTPSKLAALVLLESAQR